MNALFQFRELVEDERQRRANFKFLTQAEFDALTEAERAIYQSDVQHQHKLMEAFDRAVRRDRGELRTEYRGESVNGRDIYHDTTDLNGE